MRFPFLDRKRELERLRARLHGRAPSFCCVYGRRRVGKSRLLQEAVRDLRAVYYVGDERESPLQRRALAREIGRVVPGFERVEYPDWEALLERFRADAPAGTVLALDELPYLVARAPELPSLLQKHVDSATRSLHLVVCGSSQRMMHGLVLDATAPLYGRAHELLKIGPLPPSEALAGFRTKSAERAVESFAVFGGIPRYWELARECKSWRGAVARHVLDPAGVLHREPEHLLSDDLRDVAQASSILSLIGQGANRVSEIAGRLGHPSTSLSRPVARLLELGFLARDVPFGVSPKDSKKSLYRIADPFLRFWFRFVQPNLSLLERGSVSEVSRTVERELAQHVSSVWEDLVRGAIHRLPIGGHVYTGAAPWWGGGSDGQRLELDVVASRAGGHAVVGEVKVRASARDAPRLLSALERKAARCPALDGMRVTCVLFVLHGPKSARVVGAADVLAAYRE